MALTPADRKLRAQIAANTRWSRDEDAKANAERGQAGLLDKFRREVAAESPGLVEPELSRRAERRRRAHMQRLALARSKARRTAEELARLEAEAARLEAEAADGDAPAEADAL